MKWILICAAMLLGLAACDGDAGATSDPTKTFTPTATGMDTPSSSATSSPSGPVEPTLPAAAKRPTKAGAEAYIHYFWALVSYAQVTGDLRTLKGLAGPACSGCRGGSDFIANVWNKGGSIKAGPYRIETLALTHYPTSTGTPVFGGEVTTRSGHQVIRVPGEPTQRRDSVTETFTISVTFVDDAWRTDILGPAS